MVDLADTEVSELRRVASGDQDIARLHISVRDVVPVGECEA